MPSAPFELIQRGGPIMWVILACSVVAAGVFMERFIYFHRNSSPVDVFLSGITKLLRRGRYDEALDRCDEAYGPPVRVVQAAIIKRQLPKSELREVVQEVAQMQVPQLEANLGILATIARITPLLGLLGTVTGMISAFMKIDQAMGAVPVSLLANSIWEALITTAGGLVVAIPAYVAYDFLASRVQAIITDMERCGIEVIQILCDPPVNEPDFSDAKTLSLKHSGEPAKPASDEKKEPSTPAPLKPLPEDKDKAKDTPEKSPDPKAREASPSKDEKK